MASSLFIRVILPNLLLFILSITSLIYVFKVIPGAATEKGIWFNSTVLCPRLFNENFTLLKPLENSFLGGFICTILGIFDAALGYGFDGPSKSKSRLSNLDGLMFLGILVAFILIESSRSNRPYPMFAFVLITILVQIITAAATLPYFWMLFLWKDFGEEIPSSFDIIDAKSGIIATVLGYFLPTWLFVLNPHSVRLNTLWQIFPLIILVLNKLSELIFTSTSTSSSSKQTTKSGNQLIKRFYLAVAISQAIINLLISPPNLKLIGISKFISLPRLASSLNPNKGDTFASAAFLLLQWDSFFMFLAASFSLSWAAGNWMEGIKTLVWLVFTTPVIGLPAAFSGSFYLREVKIDRNRSLKAR